MTQSDLPRFSHSQLNSYMGCGEQYRLVRRHKLPDSTSWALVGGSAFHTFTEAWDQLGPVGVDLDPAHFNKLLDDQVRAQLESDRNDAVTEEDIRPTGRKSKDWPNKRDRSWWEHHGPIFAQQYIDWRQDAENDVMPLDSEILVEEKVSGELGGMEVLGFIDRVILDGPLGAPAILDIKTGAPPKSALQLGTYKVILEQELGIEIPYGVFYLAEEGKASRIYDLRAFNREYVESLYEQAARGLSAGVFLPNPQAFCDSCPVKKFCGLYGNRPPLDADIPLLEPSALAA